MKYALTLALVLALSLVAQAAVTPPVTINGITATVTQDTTTPPTIAGLTAYIITLSSPNAIASVDGRIDAVGAGHLYQTFAFGGAAATPDGEGLTVTTAKNDTHILVPLGSQTPARGADENLIGFDYTGAVVDSTLHNGTTLCGVNGNTDGEGTNTPVPNDWSKTMAIGIKGSPTSLAFARVVLDTPSNALGAMFNFKVVDSQSAFGQFTFNILAVPEPMTLSLLGAGALALIRRRR
jgi:hypothetical protein